MLLKYITVLCTLGLIHCEKLKTPAVYEETDETSTPQEIPAVRIARHPNSQLRNVPPVFDYKSVVQQDPQRLRYAQQQQVDSYVRAYRQQQLSKRLAKARKLSKQQTSDTSSKPEVTPTPKETTNHLADVKPIHDARAKKVVDLKNAFGLKNHSASDISRKVSTDREEKVPEESSDLGYQVQENDQEVQPSNRREERVYLGQEDALKALQYQAVSSDLLTKPMYVLADPQSITTDLLRRGIGFALSEHNLQLNLPQHAGFQQASKADLEALNALLRKPPVAQLQGLSDLVNQQGHAEALPTPQPQLQVVHKDHTPITEDVVDIANPQSKPNIRTDLPAVQSGAKAFAYVPELKLAEPAKNIYDKQHDGLQYAAQYAFGYKIRDFHSGNDFGHEEVRDGDTAKGHYHVMLPDGRLQQVEYWADPSGYHAKVTYSSAGVH